MADVFAKTVDLALETIDKRNRRIAELEAALKRVAIDARVLAVRLENLSNSNAITAEIGDYFAETSHKAREISKFCVTDQDGTPALDAALAGAKREALESAADKLSDPQWAVVQRVIRRMAREVQLNNVQRTPDSSQEVKP